MERSEPSLVPEWLKSSGSVTGSGATNHQFAPSSLHSDDYGVSKPTRNKLLANLNDHDLGRPSASDRTTSSYFRSNSSSNGSAQLRPYNSFGRSHRDREWDKDICNSHDKEKLTLGDHRHWDYHDPLGKILPSRFEKEGLRRSHSMITGRRGETWPRKVASESSNGNKNNQNSGNGLLSGGSPNSNVHKATFERDFPSLGAEERQAAPEIGRVPSPGLSTAVQSLQLGASAVIGGDKWTSALAEVPMIMGSNGTSSSVQLPVPVKSASGSSSTMTGLNMAETLTKGPPRAQTIPQLAVGTQRLEELAIKQSRQLIPVTPSMPKALVLNSSEKPRPKIGLQQVSSSHLVNHSPLGGSVKSDVSKTSSAGKLHVLKPAREKNGVSSAAKDSLSPTSSSKVVTSPLAVAPSVIGSAPLRSPGNNPILSSTERKPALVILEKRPTPQAQSRSDFFNLVRKKSMTNSSSSISGAASAVSPSVSDKAVETETVTAPAVSHSQDAPLVDSFGENRLTENREDEETAFLRSLGWEENAGEDEGLTEEEISEFYRDASKYINSRPPSRNFRGI